MRDVSGYNDPHDARNGSGYHTGKTCIELGCDRPAGTAWSPLWCFECNVERMDRISAQLRALVAPRNDAEVSDDGR